MIGLLLVLLGYFCVMVQYLLYNIDVRLEKQNQILQQMVGELRRPAYDKLRERAEDIETL